MALSVDIQRIIFR